jgi:hypothetical protein
MSDRYPTPRQLYLALQGAIRIECDASDEPLEISGITSIVRPRKRKILADGALPSRENVRAILRRALDILDDDRSQRWEIGFLRLALERHLELGITLEQAFGYAKVGKGAQVSVDADRALRIAVAVFEQRFIKGNKTDIAGYEAGKKYRVGKTQALAAFAANDRYALESWKIKRLEKKFPQLMDRTKHPGFSPDDRRILKSAALWSPAEERRIRQYYDRKQRQVERFLA